MFSEKTKGHCLGNPPGALENSCFRYGGWEAGAQRTLGGYLGDGLQDGWPMSLRGCCVYSPGNHAHAFLNLRQLAAPAPAPPPPGRAASAHSPLHGLGPPPGAQPPECPLLFCSPHIHVPDVHGVLSFPPIDAHRLIRKFTNNVCGPKRKLEITHHSTTWEWLILTFPPPLTPPFPIASPAHSPAFYTLWSQVTLNSTPAFATHLLCRLERGRLSPSSHLQRG